ncbi:acid shock protein [Phytobacter sp. V91]|uniref:acid shock protein n=1 Tax=Phytobacter sp. V91 TaxID=3369425 RepID=UPI003F5F9AFF
MKKLVTLSAIVAMSLSSFVFAADDVPPPPKHPVTQDGNHQHKDENRKQDGKHDGKEWKHGDKKENRDAPPPKRDGKADNHDGKAANHDGKKPPRPPEDKR